MSKIGIEVNPATVRVGDKIAIQSRPHHLGEGYHSVSKSREVKRRDTSRCTPECVHLDHECYDTRFATVVKVLDETPSKITQAEETGREMDYYKKATGS